MGMKRIKQNVLLVGVRGSPTARSRRTNAFPGAMQIRCLVGWPELGNRASSWGGRRPSILRARCCLRNGRQNGVQIVRQAVGLQMNKEFERGERKAGRGVDHSVALVVPAATTLLSPDPTERHWLRAAACRWARPTSAINPVFDTFQGRHDFLKTDTGIGYPIRANGRFSPTSHSLVFSSLPSTSLAAARTRASLNNRSDSTGLSRTACLRRAAVRRAIPEPPEKEPLRRCSSDEILVRGESTLERVDLTKALETRTGAGVGETLNSMAASIGNTNSCSCVWVEGS